MGLLLALEPCLVRVAERFKALARPSARSRKTAAALRSAAGRLARLTETAGQNVEWLDLAGPPAVHEVVLQHHSVAIDTPPLRECF
jgi:hypothetical protein